MTHTAYIGLGSNLQDPPAQLARAVSALRARPGIEVRRLSPLYRSDPWGDPQQPDYCNAVAELATSLSPRALLGEMLAIEAAQGRVRGRDMRYGPRTLDLDLLLHGECEMAEAGLVLPHPRMHERGFVLLPLYDLAPTLAIPGLGPVSGLLRAEFALACRRWEGA